MKWVWELKKWPEYEFQNELYQKDEQTFLTQSGLLKGAVSHLEENDTEDTSIQIILEEALATSKIEGELLNRDSVQSSIRKQLGLQGANLRTSPLEYATAELMSHIYQKFNEPLSNETLYLWHSMLMNGRRDINIGMYREHSEPMQIISGNYNSPKVFYEAPPSGDVLELMNNFIKWFNENVNSTTLSVCVFASLIHLRFLQIHPFEDGNGRIGRALCEKAVSMRFGFRALLSLSKVIEKQKKAYYEALQKANHSLSVHNWLHYHSKLLLAAQEHSLKLVDFTLKKSKLFRENQLNERQEKVIKRIFDEGLDGFRGGLSAANYRSISRAPSATVTRDLSDLVEKRVLKKEGVLKGTRYFLT